MAVKQIVVLLAVQICLVACQEKSAEERQMIAEIERLESAIENAERAVAQQGDSALAAIREHEIWESAYREQKGRNAKAIRLLKEYSRHYNRLSKLSKSDLADIKDAIDDLLEAYEMPNISEIPYIIVHISQLQVELEEKHLKKTLAFLKQTALAKDALDAKQARLDRAKKLHAQEVEKLALYRKRDI